LKEHLMTNQIVQRMYSEIIVRGRRNAPTFTEVKRDATALTSRLDAIIGLRS
jgi:hypothetical protein